MSMSDLYFYANEQLLLKNLIKVDESHFNQVIKADWSTPFVSMDYESWKNHLAQFNFDVSRIRVNSNPRSFRQYFYEGDYITVEINTLNPEWLTNEFMIKVPQADNYAKKLFDDKDYALYFFSEQNLFAIDYFHRHYEKIDKNDKFSAFKSVYLYCNYGFELFDKDLLDNVFKLANNNEAIKELKSLGKVTEGKITIYRGMGERSTPLNQAVSWTLSLDTARRFAHNFGQGEVYEAEVEVEDILEYITERNEEEIWMHPNAVIEPNRLE